FFDSGVVHAEEFSFTTLPFTLIGLALSIFLGFRNNSSYDRFWEGRKLWGQLINTTRTLTRQTQTLTHADGEEQPHAHQDFERRQVYMLIGYVHALRHHLRGEPHFVDCAPLLDAEVHAALEGDP